MKKSQIYGQVFIYVLTMVLVSFILIYGYTSIQSFRKRAEQVSCTKFRNDLQNAIDSIAGDFGSIKRKELQLCSGYTQACFVESVSVPSIPPGTDPIIRDSVLSGSGRNVFLVDNIASESFYTGKISVEPDVMCISSPNGRISLRLEGKGSHALLGKWEQP